MGEWYSLSCGDTWEQLLQSGDLCLKVVKDASGFYEGDEIIHVKKWEVIIHWLAAFLMDGILFSFFLFVIPLLLAHTLDTMEYTFNLFAVAFINFLDDIPEVVFEIVDDGTTSGAEDLDEKSKQDGVSLLWPTTLDATISDELVSSSSGAAAAGAAIMVAAGAARGGRGPRRLF
jgi:hypothetical protein